MDLPGSLSLGLQTCALLWLDGSGEVAISLQNGRMVEALEEKATTYGLTGPANHRTSQERFSALLGRAKRHRCACHPC